MDDVKKDAALTMRDDSVTEEGITFLRGWRH
jgi:hypothetical protein